MVKTTTALPDPDSIPQPHFGEELNAIHPCTEALELLLRRRSTTAKNLAEPGPDTAQLRAILRAGARVPDHGKLSPWRFIVFQGEDRQAFGEVLAKTFAKANTKATDDLIAFERDRFLRAPLVIGVISVVRENIKIPEWEQILSAGAVCQNMILAGQAMGFAGQWLTEWYAYDPAIKRALALNSGERIAGFLYFGTATEAPTERVRPDLDGLVQYWTDERAKPAVAAKKKPPLPAA